MKKIFAAVILAILTTGAQADGMVDGSTDTGQMSTQFARSTADSKPFVSSPMKKEGLQTSSHTTADHTAFELSLSAQAAEDRAHLLMPLPGEAGSFSNVDVNTFAKACVQLDQSNVILKKNGKNFSITCQAEDGGNVSVTAQPEMAEVVIHQTKQMNGNAIKEFTYSFNIWVPVSAPSDSKCVEKVKHAQAVGDSGDYGDVKIEFNSEVLNVTCKDAPATQSANPINPISKALQYATSLLKGKPWQ